MKIDRDPGKIKVLTKDGAFLGYFKDTAGQFVKVPLFPIKIEGRLTGGTAGGNVIVKTVTLEKRYNFYVFLDGDIDQFKKLLKGDNANAD